MKTDAAMTIPDNDDDDSNSPNVIALLAAAGIELSVSEKGAAFDWRGVPALISSIGWCEVYPGLVRNLSARVRRDGAAEIRFNGKTYTVAETTGGGQMAIPTW